MYNAECMSTSFMRMRIRFSTSRSLRLRVGPITHTDRIEASNPLSNISTVSPQALLSLSCCTRLAELLQLSLHDCSRYRKRTSELLQTRPVSSLTPENTTTASIHSTSEPTSYLGSDQT
ncbi:expressed unknown protein [Seminavis robusta]|uniref:Uncharacterized protein n=1 Tax=Seminavis robusta TaxID=568900 RepID=A0A9N8F2Y5_9STRA|nr:expressed unknown protein [Seminavis robusta]|eukprot:Sro3874_g351611.1  (119) ;mRNA; f:3536-3892